MEPGSGFSEHSRGLDQDAERVEMIAPNRGLKICYDQADCFQSPLPLAIEPFGRLRFAAANQTLLEPRLSNSGSHPDLPPQNQKTHLEAGF
tara:strand:+ start:719 stop:991 length:273 start_codon:yes stop_codon:yes gene_type:complete